MSDTELKLKFWRGDQIGAERLAAIILHIDGFSAVDPQCPLGGPDGLKDLLCEKNGWRYIAAVYFPTTEQKFKAVQDKFLHDLEGVTKNAANGIVFLTNQPLTPGERKALSELANLRNHRSIFYHLERIRSLLDNPSGYGARLEFLDIDMSREDQLSFFSQWNRSFSDQLQAHGLMIIRELSKKIDLLAESTESFSTRIEEMSGFVQQTQSLLTAMHTPSNKQNVALTAPDLSTKELTVSDLCMLHRALLFDATAWSQIGMLRRDEIWIGGPGASRATATFVPPNPKRVPELLESLLSEWREAFDELMKNTDQVKISGIAKFHHQFLNIHPFMDGNGRIARFLLTQHARELLNQKNRIIIEDSRPYFDALSRADHGDYSALDTQITQAIFGVEFIAGSPCQMSGQPCPNCNEGVMEIDASNTGVECGDCGLSIPAALPELPN